MTNNDSKFSCTFKKLHDIEWKKYMKITYMKSLFYTSINHVK